jgi:biotin transport system substrate-specific component
MSLGHILLFIPGVAWLAVLFGAEKAVAAGLTPFIAATLLKTALGAALMQASWTVVSRRSQNRD